MSRLIIVSNRLPFSIDHEGDEIKLRQSSGGLVSSIKSYFETNSAQHDISERIWVGVADFPQEDWERVVTNGLKDYDFDVHPLFVDPQD